MMLTVGAGAICICGDACLGGAKENGILHGKVI